MDSDTAAVSPAPLIRLENLGKTYPGAENRPVLRHVDLAVKAGEFLAIMGASGSGKSTLLNILGCLDTPTSGHYWLDGTGVETLDHNRLADLRNRFIGFVFQGFNLLPRASLIDNVALPLIYAGVNRRRRTQAALHLLERVGLTAQAHSTPNRISGGQQQRAAIARALINQPRLILADEPTGNLDSRTSEEIMTLFAQLNREQGITLILVTHEPDIAAYAQRLVRVVDGAIAFDGPAAPVADQPC